MATVETALTHDDARRFAKGLAQRLARTDPRYIVGADAKRSGKIFIDYLRDRHARARKK